MTATGGGSGNPAVFASDPSNSAASTRAATDSSGAGNAMFPLTAIAGAPGPLTGSNAAVLTGNPSAFITGNRPIGTVSNWTLEAWIYPTSLTQDGMAVYNGADVGGGFGFGVFGSNGSSGGCLIGLYGSIGWLNSPYCFPSANAWYHVAMVNAGGGAATFYVNGAAVGTVGAPVPSGPANVASIGMQDTPRRRFFLGHVSNVAFYSSALPAARILAHRNAGTQSAYSTSVLADAPSAFYTLSERVICSLAGSTVSFTAPGTCRINANQAGDSAYAAAPQAQQAITVASGP